MISPHPTQLGAGGLVRIGDSAGASVIAEVIGIGRHATPPS